MTDKQRNPCRIGGASGFWGDSSMGAPQLVALGQVDYLVFDYLAELTMSIMAAQRMKDASAGYATDFVAVTCKQVLADCVAKGIRIISNAGGMNPQACADAVAALATSLGVQVKIAVVLGDDVMAVAKQRSDLHPKLLTANAYLGAAPIAAALDAGAQVVITGRCVDSAVTLGACLHHFGWAWDDLDRLAQASLAGHIIECGAQGTGGLLTDWQDVPDWANIGYPVVEISADGSFVATKPDGTGGLVNAAVVAEQLLYEIHDPANYLLPDVVCDFTGVELTDIAKDQVRVSGARGKAPPEQYKVSSTFADGFKAVAQLAIIGFDAPAKARRTGEALLERTSAMFKRLGLPPYSATNMEILGTENAYGPLAAPGLSQVREAILRLAVRHPAKQALELFSREVAAPGTSFAPGTTGMDGGRPSVNPCIKQLGWLVDKTLVAPRVVVDGVEVALKPRQPQTPKLMPTQPGGDEGGRSGTDAVFDAALDEALVEVPLIAIAHGRSGDKGDISNIGIRARRPEYLPIIQAQVTESAVAAYLAHAVLGKVTRYALPGIGAFNFVCEQALGGGGMASLRHDPLGKGMAQILLSMPVRVPASVVASTGSADLLT